MSDFDQIIDRTQSNSTKWDKYAGQDILPFWVADMDFATPDFIREAIAQRLAHPILGYTDVSDELAEEACAWVERNHNWPVSPEWLVWLPGVVPGINLATKTLVSADQSVVVPTPVYYPIREVAQHNGCLSIEVPMTRIGDSWPLDCDAIERSLNPSARLLLLCNPQNPTGRIYSEAELQSLADLCLRHNLYICADEIHADLRLAQSPQHIPIASLHPDIAQRSITLYAPTKTYNLPGLSCAFAIIPNADLRSRYKGARGGLLHGAGPLAYAAASAAFNHDGRWVRELLDYLRTNEHLVYAAVNEVLPGSLTRVEATYLAWIDARGLVPTAPGQRLEELGLGLSDGEPFGGNGFVRFNFACPQPLLKQGLARFQAAVRTLQEAN